MMARSVARNLGVQLKNLIGKEVWFRTTLNGLNSGILKSVEGGDHVAISLLTVDGREQHGWRHVHANDIYLTEEDLISANMTARDTCCLMGR